MLRRPDEQGACVLYWMQNSQRADDNPALHEAIRRANAAGVPVVAFFGISSSYPGATARSWAFLLEGLRETQADLSKTGVSLVVRAVNPADGVAALAREVRAREVIVDGSVLRLPRQWRSDAARALPVPLTEVWADTIAPPDVFGKLAAGARVLRPILTGLVDGADLSLSRPKLEHPRPDIALPGGSLDTDLAGDWAQSGIVDPGVGRVRRFTPGPSAAKSRLRAFVENGLAGYDTQRNRAECEGTSALSPYLHFGQIGPHAIVRAVKEAEAPETDKAALLEQLVVRRELAWNHAYYNPDYDRFTGLPAWGIETLRSAAGDARPVLYTLEQLEASETHDDVWNAANREMTATGYMHNYMRMLWAKTILEWSETPMQAFERAVYLNDRHELDGRDPNGCAGIAWSIGGRHDRPWPRRPAFGAIRYMSSDSTRRKMNVPEYIRRVEDLVAAELPAA